MEENQTITQDQKLTNEQISVLDDCLEQYPGAERELIVRVCHHRSWRRDETLKKLEVYLGWRNEFNADSLHWNIDFPGLSKEHAMWFGGEKHLTKDGTPMWILKGSDWLPAMHDKKEIQLWMVAFVEATLQCSLVQERGLSVVMLASDLGWRNFDPNLEKFFIDTIQSKVPIKLTRMLIVEPGFILRLILKIVLPWMKPKMRKRVQLVYSMDEFEELVDLQHVPESFGGKLDIDVNQSMLNLMELSAPKKEE